MTFFTFVIVLSGRICARSWTRPTGHLLFPIAAVLLALLADLASVVAFLCCQEQFYCSWLIFNFPV